MPSHFQADSQTTVETLPSTREKDAKSFDPDGDSDLSAVTLSTKSAPAEIEWKPGCENELHSALIARLTDMTGAYLKRVATTAIAGPNVLEFSFPVDYDLDRKACDRPETIGQIEKLVAELVGQTVRIRFRTLPTASLDSNLDNLSAASKASQKATSNSPGTNSPSGMGDFKSSNTYSTINNSPSSSAPLQGTQNSKSRDRIIESPEDPYLQQVMELFGVKGWRAQSLGNKTDSTDDCSNRDEK